MAETHVELNQFPVPRVGPRHSTLVTQRSSLHTRDGRPFLLDREYIANVLITHLITHADSVGRRCRIFVPVCL